MADTTNRIGGVMSITVDGVVYQARGNFKVTGPTVKRTGVAGQDGVHGYIEEPIVPSIEGDWSIGNKLSMKTLEGITNSTAIAQLANGMTYVIGNAWTESAFEIDAHDGKVGVKIEGMTYNEYPT